MTEELPTRFFVQGAAKESKGLKLVDKFINYFPKPLMGKLKNHWAFGTLKKRILFIKGSLQNVDNKLVILNMWLKSWQ